MQATNNRISMPTEPSVALVPLASIRPKPITWLWKGWIPQGAISICDGLPGLGKSTMLVDLAARVTRGDSMPDGSPGIPPGGVLFLSFEDTAAEVLAPRFARAGADMRRVFVQNPSSDDLLTIKAEGSPLESWVREYKARLVVIDPLATAMGRSSDVRRVLAPVARMAERTGCAIVGVRHLNKGGGTSALLRGEGSIAIAGSARSVFMVAPSPDAPETRVLAWSKGNLAPRPTSQSFALVDPEGTDTATVEWRGDVTHTADDLLAKPKEPGRDSSLGAAISFLREALAKGEQPSADVMASGEAEGHNLKTLKRARKSLGVVASRRGRTWFLTLPELDAVEPQPQENPKRSPSPKPRPKRAGKRSTKGAKSTKSTSTKGKA